MHTSSPTVSFACVFGVWSCKGLTATLQEAVTQFCEQVEDSVPLRFHLRVVKSTPFREVDFCCTGAQLWRIRDRTSISSIFRVIIGYQYCILISKVLYQLVFPMTLPSAGRRVCTLPVFRLRSWLSEAW